MRLISAALILLTVVPLIVLGTVVGVVLFVLTPVEISPTDLATPIQVPGGSASIDASFERSRLGDESLDELRRKWRAAMSVAALPHGNVQPARGPTSVVGDQVRLPLFEVEAESVRITAGNDHYLRDLVWNRQVGNYLGVLSALFMLALGIALSVSIVIYRVFR